METRSIRFEFISRTSQKKKEETFLFHEKEEATTVQSA